jgi:hypothetical protein
MSSRPQRRQKFIDSKVQGALARRIIFHWLVFLAVASVAALLLQVLSDPFRPAGEHFDNLWYTHGPFLVVMVFLLPVFVIDTIKISHRFAGPVYSLRRTMREVADGKPPRKLQFRQGDFWHELASDYNAMIDRLAPEADSKSSKTEQTPVHVAD